MSALWLIEGEESSGSGGGMKSVVAITGGIATIPDVTDALIEAGEGGSNWYRINQITLISEESIPEFNLALQIADLRSKK